MSQSYDIVFEERSQSVRTEVSTGDRSGPVRVPGADPGVTARLLARTLAGQPATRWQITITGPGGPRPRARHRPPPLPRPDPAPSSRAPASPNPASPAPASLAAGGRSRSPPSPSPPGAAGTARRARLPAQPHPAMADSGPHRHLRRARSPPPRRPLRPGPQHPARPARPDLPVQPSPPEDSCNDSCLLRLRLPGPRGEVAADSQSVGVFGAENALEGGQQRGKLVAGRGSIPRPPSSRRRWRGRSGCRDAQRPGPAPTATSRTALPSPPAPATAEHQRHRVPRQHAHRSWSGPTLGPWSLAGAAGPRIIGGMPGALDEQHPFTAPGSAPMEDT